MCGGYYPHRMRYCLCLVFVKKIYYHSLGGSSILPSILVALRVECRTGNRQIVASNLARAMLCNNLVHKVVFTRVFLSASSNNLVPVTEQ